MSEKVKKIFYIAHCRFPNERAHGIQIAKTCEAFRREEVAVEVVAPRRRQQINQSPAEFYGLKEEVGVTYLWAVDFAPQTAFGFLLSSLTFGVSLFFYLWPRRKESILYSIDLDPLSFLGIVFLGQPYFFEMHGPKKKTILNNLLFGRMTGVFAINEAVKKNLLVNFPVLTGKILVQPNGVDLEESAGLNQDSARQKLGIKTNARVVVYTGSFQDWKGIETIIAAARKLEDVDFYFVGGNSNKVGRNLHFMGMRNYREMPLWRAAADILLVTGTKKDNYSYRFTSPMKLFEYMAAKKPVLASRTPAIEQVVSENEVFFHQPDDANSLVVQIIEVFKNQDKVTRKTEAAFLLAQKYSWLNRARGILEFINCKQ